MSEDDDGGFFVNIYRKNVGFVGGYGRLPHPSDYDGYDDDDDGACASSAPCLLFLATPVQLP